MTKKQFNRDYFVRVRLTSKAWRFVADSCYQSSNFLVTYDVLRCILGDKFDRVLIKVERARACKFVVRPFHGVEVTFIAH